MKNGNFPTKTKGKKDTIHILSFRPKKPNYTAGVA
jgi:hypothetical protein